jgi:hypothetical protein
MPLLKTTLIALSFLSTSVYAAGNIEFSTELSYGQEEEHITLSFDTGETCELHIKKGLFANSKDNCKFQPTKRVHSFSIKGELRRENYEETGIETLLGTGESFILNMGDDFNLLNNADNIDQLFKTYHAIISEINNQLPTDIQIPMLTFSHQETIASVKAYQTQHDIGLPKVYIDMITQYGYPADFFPLNKQRSIDDIYQNGYDYTTEQFNHHPGIEKNKAFFQDMEDVYYLFHDETKSMCEGEPVVSYTILTEGDYEGRWDNVDADQCGLFFTFLKDHFVERFISDTLGATDALPVYKDKTLDAGLSYGESEDGSGKTILYYYFSYNDIFY